ncbi:MAG: hypothetical protein FWF06_03160 [Symbiobacteriaceae bacterium]|nr:hypothetical protein [Symbiobacteriaceae bacterium]
MNLFLERFFAPEGMLQQRFPQHEHRQGQEEMAQQVYRALLEAEHTAIQAGTGLGKTFAYLVPAALYAIEYKKRVVISTATLNLQSQIITKDIPMLQQILRQEIKFMAALVKGRGNYLCRHKINRFVESTRQLELYREPGDREQWREIEALYEMRTLQKGDRDEIPFRVTESLWADIGSESDVCLRSDCPSYSDCYFYRARGEQRNADLLITNHALFFADLSIRREAMMGQLQDWMEAEDFRQFGEDPAPPDDEPFDAVLVHYDAVVFDEAQSVEDFATECFTTRFSRDRVTYLGRSVVNAFHPGGVLEWHDSADATRLGAAFNMLETATENFLLNLAASRSGERTVRFKHPDEFAENLSENFTELAQEINALKEVAPTAEVRSMIGSLARRTMQVGVDLVTIKETKYGDSYAYWLETGNGSVRQIKLACSPVSIVNLMQEGLLDRVPVVLTSATLASELVQRLGLAKPHWMRIDSPFDYQRHTRLYLPQDAPEASPQNEAHFAAYVAACIPRLTAMSKGRAFILFTSYRAMQVAYQQCAAQIQEQGWQVMMQGEKRREQLLADFIAHGAAVLFAVNSFWEGVDVPGEALSLVVLVKLPFAVPNEPIHEARMEALAREGKDPFQSYTLPQAVLRLKQGFGRLIRNKTDTGVIAVLDKRILTKRYGQRFLRDLPPAHKIYQPEEVAAFFTLLEEAKATHRAGGSFAWPELPEPSTYHRASSRAVSSSVTLESSEAALAEGLWLQEYEEDQSRSWDLPPAPPTIKRSRRKKS